MIAPLHRLFDANFLQRFLSSVVLVPIALAVAYVGGAVYNLAVAVVMLLAFVEWARMPAFKKAGRAVGMTLGSFYIGGGGLALIYLRNVPVYGFELVVFLLASVWATDSGAFLAGRLVGGPKLCPKISPNKTWAGLFGGMAFAALFGYGVALGFGATQLCAAVGVGVLIALVAQAGDLFESYVKRRSGVKDSGTLIPGHGGVLDRIDGILFASVFFAVVGRGLLGG